MYLLDIAQFPAGESAPLDAAALAFFVSKGWALPLFAGRRSTSEGERAQQRANLAWFAGQVRAATNWL